MNEQLSTCCGHPPLDEYTELCGKCKDHCGWYEEDEVAINSVDIGTGDKDE